MELPELLEFNGTECVHCHEMDPLVKRVEQGTGKKVAQFEVWHSAENDRLRERLDQGRCGGIPFFYNSKTGKWLCGSATYEELKAWAEGR